MMFDQTPCVSIVIPVYNGANYLQEAIDSALTQTYSEIEVLVINDGSTDGGLTEKIAKSYGTWIRYFSKPNGRVASALNLGIQEMKGNYFAWLSHDDIFSPEKIARQIDFLRKNEAFSACYTDYFRVDAKGVILRKIRTPWLPREKALKALFGHQYINGSTMIIKRECFSQIGLFNEKLWYTQDMEMWFRLLQRFEIGRVPEALGKQRFHSEQFICREKGPHQKETRDILDHLFNDLGSKGLLDDKIKFPANAEKLARRHIWFGRTVSRGRGWYEIGDQHLERALALWPSVRNPARLHMLLNKLTPLHHCLQRSRVKIVHWLMGRVRTLPGGR